MQLLLDASISPTPTDDACASEVLDSVPLVMRVIRKHLRRHRRDLTIPQFRALWYIDTGGDGHSLSDVADFIGLSLPAMSRLIDGLVEQKLVKRRTCDEDRRHVRLSLTASGRATLADARRRAQAHIVKAIKRLTPEQKATVVDAMRILASTFTPELQQS
jgi:DNA-binding MarR family transcriptional regulator